MKLDEKIGLLLLFFGVYMNHYNTHDRLNRIEAHQTEIINNQIQIIENQAAIDQDSFHSNE